jgi:hypothetical protein
MVAKKDLFLFGIATKKQLFAIAWKLRLKLGMMECVSALFATPKGRIYKTHLQQVRNLQNASEIAQHLNHRTITIKKKRPEPEPCKGVGNAKTK